MEPTTPTTNNNNAMKIIIAIVALALIVAALIFIRSKTEAPVDIEETPMTAQQESQQLTSDINSATTFDNESSLQEIDKQF